jgi:hypothetical protein
MALTPDAIDFIRKAVDSAAWDLAYAEQELIIHRRNLSFAKEVMRRGGFPTDIAASDDDSDACLTVEEYAAWIISDVKDSIAYHEGRLPAAHANVACAKLLLDHLPDAGIDFEEVMREARTKVAEL